MALAQRSGAPAASGGRAAPAQSGHQGSPAHGAGAPAAQPAAPAVPARAAGTSLGVASGFQHGHGRPAAPVQPRPGVGLPAGAFGVLPPPGFGNVNHPGLGYVPSAPGIGFPLYPGNVITIGPIRGGATAFGPAAAHQHRGLGRGTTIILGVPYAVPYYYGYGFGGYNSTVLDAYGNPLVTGPAAPQAPNIIIIGPQGNQAEAGQSVGTWAGPSTPDPRGTVTVYQAAPAEPPLPAAKPVTLLVFKDHSIYAVTDYWKEGDRVCYTTNYGSQNCVSLDQLDLDLSKKLNAERNVKFELP
jgi:hypothetical protein